MDTPENNASLGRALTKSFLTRGYTDDLQQKLDSWKDTEINIALFGSSGTGKSSYINAIRNLSGDEENAAAVGIVETTKAPKSYFHPNNPKVIFWDLPVVGTDTCPEKTYLKYISIHNYDFFLMFLSERIMSVDKKMVEAVEKEKKPYCFVRAKVDEKEKYRYVATDDFYQQVKSETGKQLKEFGLKPDKLFVIRNNEIHVESYDFQKLIVEILDQFSEIQRSSLTLSLTILTNRVIEAKKIELQKRLTAVSLLSAAAAAVPLPGLGCAVDVALLIKEITFYREQLGLAEKEFGHTAIKLEMTIKDLRSVLSLESYKLELTARGLLAYCSGLAVSEIAESTTKYHIPVLGCAIDATTSYSVTYYILNKLLQKHVSDAEKIAGTNRTACNYLSSIGL